MRRVGLYPGTFDPITRGHVDIISRAAGMVDHLVVGVAANLDKRPLFTLEERVSMVRAQAAMIAPARPAPNRASIEVAPFDGLLIHFARHVGAGLIVRGLRAFSDFEYEYQMVSMNRAMEASIETVFLMADAECQAISSRLVKEIARLGGDVSRFVIGDVASVLSARLEERKNGAARV